MKISKSLFVLTFLVFGFTLSASSSPNFDIKNKVVDENTIVIRLYNLQQVSTKISIESLDGETSYFTDSVQKHNGYTRKIKMDKLADGKYIIHIKQGDSSKKQVMVVKANKIQLSNVEEG